MDDPSKLDPTTPATSRPPRIPPRWFVRTAWVVHRGLYRATRGRRGLWAARPERWGAMQLTTTGRRTGRERAVIVAYFEDGPNLVTLAMNGWAEPEPAWWLNLLADPEARVMLPTGPREVRAHAATGVERERLWAAWRTFGDDVDGLAARRTRETAVVVLEPR
ncbi:deazaflavin-dependent oxidoreductase, nitroreductase family [Agromyces sp. CF514]|uniref:nitroreductase/quinone reductase family protein n=1 Tax=Agromyces sp. CF514 TaxID=1881031 RepID=UPI0008EDF59A|nr:nitroreductase/quinone reductase family protein [Agromyces sp. CF514]SFR84835.1 deazaflavin-dependent oxidoreductase, nitroreductase family [Agromyces sp. CF514]